MTRLTSMQQNRLELVKQAQRYIEQLQKLMRLQDWDIEVAKKQPESSDHLMEIVITRRRKHAAIRISDKAAIADNSAFLHCLIHELVHLLFDELDFWAKGSTKPCYQEYEELRERAVDHISKIIYSSLLSKETGIYAPVAQRTEREVSTL